jgi:hypothetical protein
LAENTILVYGTDNGAETATWPDGGITPFHGEKGTTWEGGFRVPMLVRWPGVIKPGTFINEIFSQEDWMPTLLAAAGEPNIVDKLKQGYKAQGKSFKAHPDGYNFVPYFKGEVKSGPREEILYFGQGGELNAVRWKDWKVNFAVVIGVSCRGDPCVSLVPQRNTNSNENCRFGNKDCIAASVFEYDFRTILGKGATFHFAPACSKARTTWLVRIPQKLTIISTWLPHRVCF